MLGHKVAHTPATITSEQFSKSGHQYLGLSQTVNYQLSITFNTNFPILLPVKSLSKVG